MPRLERFGWTRMKGKIYENEIEESEVIMIIKDEI
jgi:hypothetical protein